MKRFANILISIASLFTLAVAFTACDDNKIDDENPLPGVATKVSFVATAGDITRTYLEQDGELFHTKWVGDETLCVEAADDKSSFGETKFYFTNTKSKPNTFTCSAEGVGVVIGKRVKITYAKDIANGAAVVDSSAGTYGMKLSITTTLEDKAEVKLIPECAVLLYSSAVDVTFTADGNLFCEAGVAKKSIVAKGGNTMFVAIAATADAATSYKLSYTVNGTESEPMTLNPAYGKIYDLGALTSEEVAPENPTPDDPTPAPASTIYFVPNSGWMADGAWFAAYYWNDSSNTAVKLADENADGIYECAVPEGMPNVLFCRMNPAYTEFSWNNETEGDHVWNQTIDTVVGAEPANYYYITGWDTGEWHEAGYVVPEAPTAQVYLVPNDSWKADGAWFAAYYWSDSASGSVKLTDSDSDGIYEGQLPVGMPNVLFCRMNPAYPNFGWNSDTENDHVWNQTQDTTVGVAPANYYYITGWDTGEWHEAGYTVTPGAPSTPAGSFALAGTFNGWGDLVMTNDNGIHSVKGVGMEAYAELKVKDAASWDTNFGVASVAYMNPNHHVAVAQGGDNIAITEAGTYDVYFDHANLKLYVVTAGTDYTTAPLQTVNGKEPEIVAPEVTENVVYFKPNNTWNGSGARFSAYLWNDSGNTWVSAVDADSDGIYEIYIPDGYGTNIIFCRMKNGTTANSWTNKQYQTVDLVIPTDGKNLFTLNEGGEKISGTWSTK